MNNPDDQPGSLYDESPTDNVPALPLPLNRPFMTYILLGAIGLMFVLETVLGGSTNRQVLVLLGANYGPGIMEGQVWRLFASMFLHIGIAHLAFNAYALFIFGLEMERLYNPSRFLIVYILSGLFGSLTSFATKGPLVLSAGASGAIFGVIGMNLAYFLFHRDALGRFGKARVQSTLVIIAINLLLGFTIPGIDNMAHIGGLVAGFVLGFGLAPRYEIINQYTSNPRVVDKTSLLARWWVVALGVFALAGSVPLAILFWQI